MTLKKPFCIVHKWQKEKEIATIDEYGRDNCNRIIKIYICLKCGKSKEMVHHICS